MQLNIYCDLKIMFIIWLNVNIDSRAPTPYTHILQLPKASIGRATKKFIVLLGALANCKSIVNELDHRPIIISQGIFYVLKF